jgi:AcrR family transcriptional regulator
MEPTVAASTPEAPATRSRRRLTPEAREAFRNELISIARQVFLTEGYTAVTIRRITAEAGVTPMTFYWYFDNKDALLTVIWNEILQESAQHCQRQADGQTEVLDRIATYFVTFIDYWLAHRDYFRFIFLNDSPHVDFVGLRTQLFTQPGVTQHFHNYAALALPLFESWPDAAEQADRVRVLSMYKAFGFLHIAIGVYGYSDEEARQHRDMVESELRHCLERWSQPPART